MNRSKSNLGSSNNSSSDKSNFPDSNKNITLERNGSMPNLTLTGKRPQTDKITKLRFAYDRYLTSLTVKYAYQMTEKKVTSNIFEQKEVFREELDVLKNQLETLSEELNSKNSLKIEKKILENKFEVIEMLSKAIKFNDSDEEIMSLFVSTASKVVVKNFKKMDETDLNAVKNLINEIIESLKSVDYESKINARIQLKNLLIKVEMLSKELDECKIKVEKLFDEQESLQNHNLSMKILKDQFGDDPDTSLLPKKTTLFDDIQKMLDDDKNKKNDE